MSGQTTAFVLVANFRTGPFRDRAWKVRHGIALIEKLRPVWTSTPIGFSAGEMPYPGAIYLPPGNTPAEELVFIIAATVVCDENFLQFLESKDLGSRNSEGQFIIRFVNEATESRRTLPPEIIEAALASILGVVRLGIVHFTDQSLLDKSAIKWLRNQGVDLDSFVLSEDSRE